MFQIPMSKEPSMPAKLATVATNWGLTLVVLPVLVLLSLNAVGVVVPITWKTVLAVFFLKATAKTIFAQAPAPAAAAPQLMMIPLSALRGQDPTE